MRDEEKNIESLVHKILKIFPDNSADDHEIIIIDDNSIDSTGTIADRLSDRHPSIKVIHRESDPGVGHALKEGFSVAKGDIIITLDGDLSHDPEEIPRLLEHIYSGADLVIGSRYMEDGNYDMTAGRACLSRAYNLLARAIFRAGIHDFTSGFRALKKGVAESISLSSNDFAIHPEIHIKAIKKGFRVVEVPITYHYRHGGKSKLKYKENLKYLRVVLQNIFQRD